MTTQHRSYRKKISTPGLIYLGGKEHAMTIENISISGLLAKLDEPHVFDTTEQIFEIVKHSPQVDIYLPEMKLAGLAEIVWSEITEGVTHVALEFKDISYEVSDLLYRRKAYRKAMTGPGLISFHNEEHLFNTENVSVEGLMIRVSGHIKIETGEVISFSFEPLALSGTAKVMWVEHCADSTLLGLCYEQLAKGNPNDAIPRFYR